MTTDELFVILRDAYSSAMWEEDFAPLADIDQMTLQELDAFLVQLGVMKRAVGRLAGQVETQVAFLLGEGGSARVGDTVYRYRPNLTTKITDPRLLVDWLAADWSHVVPVTPSTTLRKGGVDAVCEQRGIDPGAFWETFTETTKGDPKVDRIPIDKAPQFLQKLDDGEVRKAS